MNDILLVILASASPISELRGGIPLGIGLGLDPALTYLVAVITNILVYFPARLILDVFYRSVLHRLPLFDRYLLKVRERGKPKVDKYGLVGLALFVAVPLPITGAYTGTVHQRCRRRDCRRHCRAGTHYGCCHRAASIGELVVHQGAGAV